MKNLYRHVAKHKAYAAINLFGLTLGITVCIFIFLYVEDEFSYDKWLPGYDRVFRIQPLVTSADERQEWATSEGFIMPALAPMYPEIEAATRMMKSDEEEIFTVDSTRFAQSGVIAVDTSFFKVFPFEFIHGDRNTAFQRRDNVVLTEQVARNFFGNINPVGKFISGQGYTMQVTGVVKDMPANSHFHFSMAIPLKNWVPDADQARFYAFYTYIRLTPQATVNNLAEQLKTWYGKHGQQQGSSPSDRATAPTIILGMKPIADIHLQSHAEREFEANGSLQVVWIFVSVAFLILVVAAINYVNLSNAIAFKRMKEVAVRKTIGASKPQLFFSFLADSYVFTLVAILLAIVAVVAFMNPVNTFIGKHFSVSALTGAGFVLAIMFAWLLLGFLSGFYPATILSSFNPIQALKSNIRTVRSGSFSLGLKRGLIAFQFAISSMMIVCAFTIRQQLEYIDAHNVGFDKNNVLVVSIPYSGRDRLDAIKTEFAKSPVVESASVSSVVPGKRVMFLPVRIPTLAGTKATAQGTDDGSRDMRVLSADHDFVETFKLQIVEGRDFSINNTADAETGFLLNEAAVKEFKLKDPIGMPFEFKYRREPKRGAIIGVIKDFHFASMHTAIEPLMIHIEPSFYTRVSVRLRPGQELQSAITQVEQAWKQVYDYPFQYSFLDVNYDSLYRSERVTGQVMTYLTLLALVIACLGLFGIVSFFVVQRTREVGIRKVFGASQASLFRVLSNEYVFIVIAGNLLAIYPAWFLSNQWLRQFSYQADLSWTTFLMAFGVSSLLAVVSITHIILKTSKVNPATILRSE
jgi:putative ABC transport system permease protein